MFKRNTHQNHFTTVHTDYHSPKYEHIMSSDAVVEEAHTPHRSQTEPIRKVALSAPKRSKFQKG